MRRRLSCLLGIAVIAVGCATNTSAGSQAWHQDRLFEIEAAFAQDEISREAYIELKMQADATRAMYKRDAQDRSERNRYNHHWHHHHLRHW